MLLFIEQTVINYIKILRGTLFDKKSGLNHLFERL